MKDPRIDAYIAKSAPFAQEIQRYLRDIIHDALRDVEETMKWGFPHFLVDGKIVCSFAAFKAHCAFSFWRGAEMPDPDHILNPVGESAMGQLGRISTKADLPSAAVLKKYIKFSHQQNIVAPVKKVIKKSPADRELQIPELLEKALRKNKKALEHFDKMSYSHKKEYVQWIEEAKQEATRLTRLEKAMLWLSEGKHRNWQYDNKCATKTAELDMNAYMKEHTGVKLNALVAMRDLIQKTIPKLEESMYYSMPAFRYKGKVLVCFAAFKNHLGFYPCDGGTIGHFQDRLAAYKCSKGAIQIPYTETMDAKLLKDILLHRKKIIDTTE